MKLRIRKNIEKAHYNINEMRMGQIMASTKKPMLLKPLSGRPKKRKA